MRPQSSSISVAIALALGAFVGASANAALVSSGTVAFSNSVTVVDSETTVGATANNGAGLGSTSLNQFNSSLGVLTGTTINLLSTRTQSTWVTTTAGTVTTGSNGNVTSDGIGSSSVSLTIPVGVVQPFGTITQTDSCTDNTRGACTGTATTSVTNTNINVASTNLDAYVGGGTVSVSRAAPTLSAQQLSNVFNGVETTSYTLTWAGTLAATYQYLLHATSSFNGSASQSVLDLDFGNVFQNSTPAGLGFNIFNSAGDRAGLDLDSIAPSGDLAKLSTNLAAFSNLSAGSNNAFLASFNTADLGTFSASYELSLSDQDIGAATSRFGSSLTINLFGNVVASPVARANNVPEPGSMALIGLGLLGLGIIRRKQIKK